MNSGKGMDKVFDSKDVEMLSFQETDCMCITGCMYTTLRCIYTTLRCMYTTTAQVVCIRWFITIVFCSDL